MWICIYGSQQPKQQQVQTTNDCAAATTTVLLSIICLWIYSAVNLGVRSGMNKSNHCHLQSCCHHQFKTILDSKVGSALIIQHVRTSNSVAMYELDHVHLIGTVLKDKMLVIFIDCFRQKCINIVSSLFTTIDS